ncbi:aspartyl protease family protein [Phenylobacterium sp.]|uniref:aspartyl protease family protein n=1 Tax=Phenylobacterium sp. TaxID=1871053 RepID=UPI0025D428AF|nr:aspartyl protease family protein [Phenylobacterium sp.]
MIRTRLIPLALLGVLAAGPAVAGEETCRFEGGTLVVPAVVAGIAGDYILDTGTAQSVLHETRAQSAGFAETELTGDVRLAGMTATARPLKVADLDVRTWNLPTPVAGVIGADLLKGWVLDVSYAPCRVRLWEPGQAAAFRGRTLELAWDLGRPTALATASDDAHEIAGRFVIATGANAPVRLADDLAQAPSAATPDELYPQGVWFARLASVTFAGASGRDVAAGLMKPDGAVVGVLGAEVLAHFRLRFDFPAGRLIVTSIR